jgi:hypothetical protein
MPLMKHNRNCAWHVYVLMEILTFVSEFFFRTDTTKLNIMVPQITSSNAEDITDCVYKI